VGTLGVVLTGHRHSKAQTTWEVLMPQMRVAEQPEARRFELCVDGEVVGQAEYELMDDGTMVLTHVVVLPRYEGRGYGTELTRGVLDAARQKGISLLPVCSFARAYVRRNPEYADLVPEDQRDLVGVPR
jgi:predicted GNAT family acetyltransferase